VFFITCSFFAALDVLGGGELYENNMDMKETTPVSPQFETYLIPDKNFMINTGSYLLIQAGIMIYFFGLVFINKIATFRPHSERARGIGMWAFKPNWGLQMLISTKKLYLESYFDIVLCAFLNALALIESTSPEDFSEFFTGRDNLINQFFAAIGLFLTFTFPPYVYWIIRSKFSRLADKEVREVHGIFYEGIKVDTMNNAQYNTYFMLRRLVTVSVLIFMPSLPFFQCQFLMIFSTINLVYIISCRPMIDPASNKIEIFNEFCVVICTHLVNVLLNAAVPVDFREEIGWVLIIVAVFNIGSNLCLTILSSI